MYNKLTTTGQSSKLEIPTSGKVSCIKMSWRTLPFAQMCRKIPKANIWTIWEQESTFVGGYPYAFVNNSSPSRSLHENYSKKFIPTLTVCLSIWISMITGNTSKIPCSISFYDRGPTFRSKWTVSFEKKLILIIIVNAILQKNRINQNPRLEKIPRYMSKHE